jgi:hypothetical protein
MFLWVAYVKVICPKMNRKTKQYRKRWVIVGESE